MSRVLPQGFRMWFPAILHEFWRLDYQQVYDAVWRELGVLGEFARQIKRRLES